MTDVSRDQSHPLGESDAGDEDIRQADRFPALLKIREDVARRDCG